MEYIGRRAIRTLRNLAEKGIDYGLYISGNDIKLCDLFGFRVRGGGDWR